MLNIYNDNSILSYQGKFESITRENKTINLCGRQTVAFAFLYDNIV